MNKQEEALQEYYKTMSEANPAVVPEAPEPHEKQYKVVGEAAVLGHQKGEVFSAILSAEQEALYTEYGHLVVVTEEQPSSTEGQPLPTDTEGSPAPADTEQPESTEQAEE